ncbi:hypothetical protein [Mastigocladopsis repens]|nr:hypothetical protein [Mastigocladopsis repens]
MKTLFLARLDPVTLASRFQRSFEHQTTSNSPNDGGAIPPQGSDGFN